VQIRISRVFSYLLFGLKASFLLSLPSAWLIVFSSLSGELRAALDDLEAKEIHKADKRRARFRPVGVMS
jgi:hypothetical protein